MICSACGVEYNKGLAPDPCIGTLPDPVVSACCGHGNDEHASVVFGGPPERTALRGVNALKYIALVLSRVETRTEA